MNLHIEETGPVERRLRIEIPTVEVDAAFDAVYKQMRGTARIPGFRRGKVPRSVLERYFGARAGAEVLEKLVRDSLTKALEDSELDVISEPRLEPGEQPKQGSAYAYEASVEIRPAIELGRIKGLEVERPMLPEPETDPVEAHLEELRQSQAQVIEEEEGVALSQGHLATISFVGTIDGERFEGGSSERATFEIGADQAIPGFDDELVGLSVGSEHAFELEFPSDYPREEVAGKLARFEVRVLEVQRKELPDLDDELAKDVSEFETLDELEADIRQRVERGRERQLQQLQRDAVVKAVIAANPFPVPPSLVERQLQSRLQRALGQLENRLPPERLGGLVEGWREEWRPHAERDVRLGLLVPEIAKAEGIEVSKEEVDEKLAAIAEEQGKSKGEIRKAYREGGVLPMLEGSLLEDKVVEFLVSEASLSDA
ncbi:MAG: trigger factor [Myxococcota bacterium]